MIIELSASFWYCLEPRNKALNGYKATNSKGCHTFLVAFTSNLIGMHTPIPGYIVFYRHSPSVSFITCKKHRWYLHKISVLTSGQIVVIFNSMWTVTPLDDEDLTLIRSGAALDYASTQTILRQIYLENDGMHSTYKWFVDLSNIEDINTNFDSIRDLILRYREINKFEANTIIAAYLPFGILRAIIDVYVQEVESSSTTFKVSSSFQECADYLSVDKELLHF